MRNFPKPVIFSPGCSRWRLSELEHYENETTGAAYPDRAPGDEVYLTDRQVAARYNVARVTPWRWARTGDEVAA